jgi:hypothetical protein
LTAFVPQVLPVDQGEPTMNVLIAYDGSEQAKAAIDDLRRAGMPRSINALVVSVGEVMLPALTAPIVDITQDGDVPPHSGHVGASSRASRTSDRRRDRIGARSQSQDSPALSALGCVSRISLGDCRRCRVAESR